MAKDKKELDDDLLTGGKTLSSDADNKKAGHEQKAGRCEKGRKERS